ncbi:MAG: hypothetical protein CL608_07620 [Anaerolineaceae bacterium]|nr:hypothetical protein [Anaerolineaceae bacterium]
MLGFIVIAVIGSSIGYFGGRIYHDRYGLSHFMNGLIGLVGSLLAAFLTVWSLGNGFEQNAYLDWRVWLAAAVGAFVLVWLAGFLRGRQYE